MAERETRSLVWSARAKRDLEQIAGFIARDKPGAARRWVAKLRKAAERAPRRPFAGRIVPEIQREEVREVLLGSYRIVYGVRDDHIFVFTVFGGGKQLSSGLVPED